MRDFISLLLLIEVPLRSHTNRLEKISRTFIIKLNAVQITYGRQKRSNYFNAVLKHC
jgi:hypothetical protein